VYRPTVGNVADDDTNKYIYYTLYKTHSFLLILLDLTLSALSLSILPSHNSNAHAPDDRDDGLEL